MAYFEDVDLCFTLRECGLATVYEPRSTVRHVGGASGTPEKLRRWAARNHAAFMRKWDDALTRRPALPEGEPPPYLLMAARDVHALDRFLVVADDEDAEAPIETEQLPRLALALARGWPSSRVTFLSTRPIPRAEELLDSGVEAIFPSGGLRAWLDERLFHYSVVVVPDVSGTGRLASALRASQPQAVLLSLSDVAGSPYAEGRRHSCFRL